VPGFSAARDKMVMCLAVERRIEAPGLGGARYEDDVLVVEGGAELLTPAEECYFACEG
jgi:Xaa-Pro aminopeptidase